MLTHTLRNGLRQLLLISILFLPFLCRAQTTSAPQLNLVIALDLSTSEAARAGDGKTEFEKNVTAVNSLLARVPPASRVIVIGITENSFSQPYILLSARVAGDKGYFGEKIANARQQLIRAWQERSSRLRPTSHSTEILGAVFVAAQIFQQTPDTDHRVLVVYSDMRQFTRELNLEAQDELSTDAALARVGRDGFVPDVKGVEVYALGVEAAGKDLPQWKRNKQFWTAYFNKCGAILSTYSILRDAPNMNSVAGTFSAK